LAAVRFEEFTDKWGTKYPAITGLWRSAWEEFIPFLDYGPTGGGHGWALLAEVASGPPGMSPRGMGSAWRKESGRRVRFCRLCRVLSRPVGSAV
jgi:hypothetical protein